MLSYPPQELWPEKIYSLAELRYSDTLNTCDELLDAHIRAGRGSAPAVYSPERNLTYNELANEVNRIAGALRAHGVKRGDCVVLRLLNRPHFISTFLALLRIGAVAIPTAPLLRHREITAIIESADPVML